MTYEEALNVREVLLGADNGRGVRVLRAWVTNRQGTDEWVVDAHVADDSEPLGFAVVMATDPLGA